MINIVKNLIPRKRIYQDDTFIASFPKSGNTWLRFILSHLIIQSKYQLTFKDYDRFIPEFDKHYKLIQRLERPRILKTHREYDKRMKKAIYIVRDPRDVYVSYYYYLKSKSNINTTISQFITNNLSLNKSWKTHINSWSSLENKIIIRYEDLHVDPFVESERVARFIGLNITHSILEKAIKMSSFDNLSKIEDLHGRYFPKHKEQQKSNKFMRQGIIGSWRNELSTNDAKNIESQFSDEMKFLKYI